MSITKRLRSLVFHKEEVERDEGVRDAISIAEEKIATNERLIEELGVLEANLRGRHDGSTHVSNRGQPRSSLS